MSLFSTLYGGILEVGRYSYEHGIVTFVMFGIFYYIAALIYALFIASKISESNLSSIPELFYNSFNKKSAILAAIIIVFLASPAPYIKMLAIIFDFVYSIGFIISILLSITAVVLLYSSSINMKVRASRSSYILALRNKIFTELEDEQDENEKIEDEKDNNKKEGGE